jgi:xanthine dehydrogenase large subunit
MNALNSLDELTRVAELGRELPHESALLHVTGQATYTDDIPELRGTLYAALVLSPVAHGELLGEGIDRAALLAQPDVVAVFTARDIPGENNCGPIVHDDPFLASRWRWSSRTACTARARLPKAPNWPSRNYPPF